MRGSNENNRVRASYFQRSQAFDNAPGHYKPLLSLDEELRQKTIDFYYTHLYNWDNEYSCRYKGDEAQPIC